MKGRHPLLMGLEHHPFGLLRVYIFVWVLGSWLCEKFLFFPCNDRRGHRGACDSVSVDEKWPLGCGWACGFADCFVHKMHHGDGRFGGFMYKYNTLYED